MQGARHPDVHKVPLPAEHGGQHAAVLCGQRDDGRCARVRLLRSHARALQGPGTDLGI
jgi:hypothetical protein